VKQLEVLWEQVVKVETKAVLVSVEEPHYFYAAPTMATGLRFRILNCNFTARTYTSGQCCGCGRFLTGSDFRKRPDPDPDLNKFSANIPKVFMVFLHTKEVDSHFLW
jgi:hypothetical protein